MYSTLAKLIVLNSVGAGLLVAAYMTGLLPILWSVDKYHAFPVVGGLMLLGLWMVATKRITGARELADDLPLVGLGFTITGLLLTANAGLDLEAFKKGMVDCMTGTLSGFTSYYWLKTVINLCRED